MTHERGEQTPGQEFRFQAARQDEPACAERVPDFSRLDGTDILNGIDEGTISDPRAVHVLVRKRLAWERQLYQGDSLKELESRYAPLLTGEPQSMARYCQRRADEYMTFGYSVDSDYTNYPAAAHWYEMAARFARQAADTREEAISTQHPQVLSERQAQRSQEQLAEVGGQSPAVLAERGVLGPPAERAVRAAHAGLSATAILDGIEDGTITDPAAVQDLVAWQLERDRDTLRGNLLKKTEAEYAPLIYGEPKALAALCLDEAHRRLGGDTPGSLHVDCEAAGRWYRMAARFAWRAERERYEDTR